MVTNPSTRARGHRLHLRHPQRDVRQPHRLRHRPRRLRDAGGRGGRPTPWPGWATRSASSAIWPGAGGVRRRPPDQDPLDQGRQAPRCGWPPTGPRPSPWPASWPTASSSSWPTPSSPNGWSRPYGRPRWDAGRDPAEVTICVAAPAYVGDDLAHAREQCRWFGGMVGNHVADLVALRRALRHGAGRADRVHRVPGGLRLRPRGQSGNPGRRLRVGHRHRPLLSARPARRTHGEARRAPGAGRGPVRASTPCTTPRNPPSTPTEQRSFPRSPTERARGCGPVAGIG